MYNPEAGNIGGFPPGAALPLPVNQALNGEVFHPRRKETTRGEMISGAEVSTVSVLLYSLLRNRASLLRKSHRSSRA